MRRFRFRLQRVLDYRVRLEEKAERLFGEAHMRRLAAEAEMRALAAERDRFLAEPEKFSVERAQLRLLYCETIEDRLRCQQIILNTLLAEEKTLQEKWMAARRDREMIERLRDKAQTAYQYEVSMAEQRELDEWATLRRAAAT